MNELPGTASESLPAALDELRVQAESRVAELLRRRITKLEPADIAQLVHELGVHQIELEMQNEQLRQAQVALEASRDRYLGLFEHAPVAYLTFELDGRIVEANGRAAALLDRTIEQLLRLHFVELIEPVDRPAYHRAYSTLLRGVGAQLAELRLRVGNGALRFVDLQIALVADDGTGQSQCRAALIDTTERMAMRERGARLAAIVDSSEDAIIGRDLQGRVTAWNEGAERLFGVPAREIIGRTMDDLVPPERRGEELRLLQRLRTGERLSHVESERRREDGHRLPVSMSLSPILDDNRQVIGSSLIARDITDRKRGERALHQRLRQLDLLSQAGQSLIMGDHRAPQTQHELFDRVRLAIGSEIYLNYSRGANPDRLALVGCHGLPPERRGPLNEVPVDGSLCGLIVRQRTPLIVEQLQDSPMTEAHHLQAEGAQCFAGFPLLAGGAVIGVAAFVSTTRQRLREGDLQVIQTVCDQVSAMLERTRLIDELHASEQSLKVADRRKDDFIATLAHELRNPLAPIRNAVGVLRQRADAPDQVAWCRDIIERQVVQMTHLLEDLLDVSRVTRNRIELRRRRILLQQAIEQAVETTRPLIEQHHQTLQLEVPSEALPLYGDLTRLTQVFANLLNNAAKYTDSSGEIRLAVAREGDEVAIRVKDNGIGIDPSQLPQVFDMFAQLEPSLERSHGGLGIGLSLARGLVELHGGRIEARSEGRGRGSEFIVWLPIVHHAADRPAETMPGGLPAAAAHGLRILVIDDNADAARTLAMVLALNGHEVRSAFDGSSGLEAAEAWRPDVAVIDIGMPDLNGYEVCRRLRAQPWGERVLLIACTGWGQDEDRQRARAAGFDAHLVKPIEAEAVLKLLPG
ncbi:PAS domain S-box protein [Aquincola sp. S2]|uniref:histidine kinase n=1 Tax=Pseudaquabacterium terrae TaxID=2732868 RepID=A0ABX2EI05_9BURK|nr:PAS domain S-box protein [Aquabacterium terrae]NRF68206.1 PAS domain S-box protein [Aquabacterium terrae]